MSCDKISPHLKEKLEMIHEIRLKTDQLEKLRNRLRQESNNVENEDRSLQDYRSELELLLQEKMAHVEELRLIHADINSLETTIKQAEEVRNRSLDKAKKVYVELIPMKDEVDTLRCSLGLEPLHEATDEGEHLPTDLLDRKVHPGPGLVNDETPSGSLSTDLVPDVYPGSTASFSFGGMSAGSGGHQAHHMPHSATAAVQTAALGVASGTKLVADPRTPAGPSAPPSFRQQPPPMKACLSCHQQIHRNAPICPLCKAKSRSRNPKKPKRKGDD